VGKLEGRVALITGAARGAGAAIARRGEEFQRAARTGSRQRWLPSPGSASEEARARGTPPDLARIGRLLARPKALRRTPLPNGP